MIYYSYIINLRGEAVDQSLIHSIESVVIDWTHQIHDIIKKDSARPILDGLDPHPMFEVELSTWKVVFNFCKDFDLTTNILISNLLLLSLTSSKSFLRPEMRVALLIAKLMGVKGRRI